MKNLLYILLFVSIFFNACDESENNTQEVFDKISVDYWNRENIDFVLQNCKSYVKTFETPTPKLKNGKNSNPITYLELFFVDRNELFKTLKSNKKTKKYLHQNFIIVEIKTLDSGSFYYLYFEKHSFRIYKNSNKKYVVKEIKDHFPDEMLQYKCIGSFGNTLRTVTKVNLKDKDIYFKTLAVSFDQVCLYP